VNRESPAVASVADVYAALPSITGKFELEYEGELRGPETVARDLIRAALGAVFGGRFEGVDLQRVIDWFELGGTLQISDLTSAQDVVEQASQVQGLGELAAHAGAADTSPAPELAAAIDFVLSGLYALKKISRSEEWQYAAGAKPARQTRRADQMLDQELPMAGRHGRKKYYN
jgi:magnesium chelatase subunit I